MEPFEVASLEAAIGWLVRTILGVLLMDKMDVWIRGVKLEDDVKKLRTEIRRVGMVVATVKGRATGNEQLAESLATLKELLYDADDVVDELDYYRLQQQVEGDTVTRDEPEGMRGDERVDEISRGDADAPNSSVGKLRSAVWLHFMITEKIGGKPVKAKCSLCSEEFACDSVANGTSSMIKHLKNAHSVICERGKRSRNPSSTGDDATENATPIVIGSSSRGKRKRTNEDSAQITAANKHTHWDKAEISNRINEITSQLKDIREEVSEVLKLHGSDLASSSNNHRSTASDQHLITSSLVQRKVYGRDGEKNNIIKMITQDKSNGVTVLPIVGIAGVGKTTLAQLVYNDPDVESKFDTKIWIWVSRNFDKVKLTREMLHFVSQETYEEINCYVKLQEILKSNANSKRLLLILDDVWDDMDDCRWNQLLAPIKSDSANDNNVILVTTRNMTVAKMIRTVGPIKLGALENDDSWLLFKSCAFRDWNYEGPEILSSIGRQIADKLKGNPLAVVTAGALLRDHLTVDHWSNILKKENWKSLGLSGGIMPALKLSYDQLPYHLQKCFSYCSIFPDKYKFHGKDLVYIWISQGFVNTHLSKRLEETGWEYLIDLVNLGFFQQIFKEEEEDDDNEDGEGEGEESSLGSQIFYSMCDVMHDFARIISRTECATIDGLDCDKILPTIQHLSIVTDSAYNKDWQGNIPRNTMFEENLRNKVTSVRKLRTLVLLGDYDSYFLQLFHEIFQTAHNLRLLHTSATSADFNSSRCSLVNTAHLRYLQHGSGKVNEAFAHDLSKLYHLQVLDVRSDTYSPTIHDGINNLVSLRHLVLHKGVYPFIASIGKLTSLQELYGFKVQNSSGFEITQLQSMNELVQLEVSQLDTVQTREEAYGAGLRNKGHLENLHLSWKDTLSDNESPADTARKQSEVLEGLKPHKHLKHLQISGYNGTSPTWLNSNMSVTSLQTLHLDCCGEWEILPSLERFPCLRKLKLNNMQKVTKILVPSLEELVLVTMPELERCSCTSVEGFNSSLRSLGIVNCEKLEVFDLFENAGKFKVENRSWLSGVRELILFDCPLLKVFNPLPPSATFSELLIHGVSTLPSMKGSYKKLHIESDCEDPSSECVGEVLAFHNLRSLKFLSINGDKDNPMPISFKDLSYLVSLKSLKIEACEIVFSSHVMPEPTHEDVAAANCKVFPSLQSLTIDSCGMTGKVLSLMLQHSPDLEKLDLFDCSDITLLSIEEEENSLSNLTSDREPQDELFLHITFNLTFTLKEMTIKGCPCLRLNGSNKGFSGFTSLEKLNIWGCPELLLSLVRKDGSDDQANGRWLLPESLGELDIWDYREETLQPCFPGNLTSLKKLGLRHSSLGSLQLHSCTALEELEIGKCHLLSIAEGLRSLGSLRDLTVRNCPFLLSYLESFSRQCNELLPRLGTLVIDDPDVLTTSFCKHLTSLHSLQLSFWRMAATRLTEEQERALVLLKSLQELTFNDCYCLIHLPARLHTLPSLKRLKIEHCSSILSLPETSLPVSLEELEIKYCGEDLNDQCMLLATSKLNVKIIT